jgi:hypothetical protein
MDDTSSVISGMRFIAVCTSDVLIWGFSGAFACKVMLCSFYAPRRITTVVFRVPVLLAPHALWDSAFGVWRFDFKNCFFLFFLLEIPTRWHYF